MKKLILLTCIVFFAMSAFLPRNSFISSIYGSIEPAEAAKKVWAIKGTDTLTVIPEAGKFSIAVSGGVWRLYIQAMKPYKDAVVDNIRVEEGKSTDAGMITLKSD
ncbi:MAG TPA: hypothetical protein VK489_09660 [Ferruginibacter sp.]|nr:hypothetical protein [Ferruginibacter sp.]